MAKNRDLELLFEIGSFRYIERMWKRFLNPDFANNADHSFRVAWIALLIAKKEGVKNTDKILKMALMHDLSETRVGDVDYLARQYVIRNEDLATEDIFKNTSLEAEMLVLWQEYKQRKTIEAKIVKDADQLDVDLEIQEQAERGFSLKKLWHEQRTKAVKRTFYTKTAIRLQEEIKKAQPHSWHLNGRNRFNSGDWSKIKKS